MKKYTSQRAATLSVLTFATFITLSNASYADYYPFRVAFENVPGVEEITGGNINAGIRILEQELDQENVADEGYVLASLCGALILNSSLYEATQVCNDAVEQFPSETAFNNRGVLRAFTADFEGAKSDFDRARPQSIQEYLEHLRTKDVGLVADSNRGLIEDLSANHDPADVNSSFAVNTASVEDID